MTYNTTAKSALDMALYDLLAKRAGLWVVDLYERPARAALARTGGKFPVPEDIHTLAGRAEELIELGTQAGEGWLLVAEMMELIEHGTPNIICAQPFACLPNHVVGRGMFKELRRRYPQANLVSIDYDPGASEVNQLNRIKLMVATAHRVAGDSGRLARWDLEEGDRDARDGSDDRDDRDDWDDRDDRISRVRA